MHIYCLVDTCPRVAGSMLSVGYIGRDSWFLLGLFGFPTGFPVVSPLENILFNSLANGLICAA